MQSPCGQGQVTGAVAGRLPLAKAVNWDWVLPLTPILWVYNWGGTPKHPIVDFLGGEGMRRLDRPA